MQEKRDISSKEKEYFSSLVINPEKMQKKMHLESKKNEN